MPLGSALWAAAGPATSAAANPRTATVDLPCFMSDTPVFVVPTALHTTTTCRIRTNTTKKGAAAPPLSDLISGSEAEDHAHRQQVDFVRVGLVALPLGAHADGAGEVVLRADAPGDLGVALARVGVDVGKAELAEDRELVRHREHAHRHELERVRFRAALVIEHAVRHLRRDVAVELVAGEELDG